MGRCFGEAGVVSTGPEDDGDGVLRPFDHPRRGRAGPYSRPVALTRR